MSDILIIAPFTLGLVILLGILIGKYIVWTIQLSHIDKLRMVKGFFSTRTLRAIREVVNESLLHRNLWATNPLLGYMHTSFALGWLLLIIVGHIEAFMHAGTLTVAPWQPIFFRYFVHEEYVASQFFSHAMDALLLYVLSGVGLAYLKRLNSRMFGMKRTTSLKPKDRISLIALWCIFPLRLIAESATSSLHSNGGFLTSGMIFQYLHITPTIEIILWTLYSVSLAVFFITLPFTRYMHIPTEVFYIFLKEYGIKLKKEYNSFSKIQVYSCSRCGVCIDACQMHHAQISNNQSVYILKNLRDENLTERKLYNCLLCGRCEEVCPVNINLNDLRISQRIKSSKEYNSRYDFLKKTTTPKADIVYFAGCMTQLTPSIKHSILRVLEAAKVDILFLDKDKGACCGRPLMQAGQIEAAKKLIEFNRQQILDSGAHTLLVSCPICYKVFLDDYELGKIRIVHHSEYFLELIQNGRIALQKTDKSVVYHDPCELGRGCKVFEQPRELISMFAQLKSIDEERASSLCCSGSLGDLSLSMSERNKIKDLTLEKLLKPQPDVLATACPLCKKTFVKDITSIEVKDIAELVAEQILN